MAHVHIDSIWQMVRKGVVTGVKIGSGKQLARCQACVYGKSTRAPIPQSGGERAKEILNLVHTDVCGPSQVNSLGGGGLKILRVLR